MHVTKVEVMPCHHVEMVVYEKNRVLVDMWKKDGHSHLKVRATVHVKV